MLPKIEPTGAYTDDEIDRTLAYRVLVHAELEACIEQLVVQTLTRSEQNWQSDSMPRASLLALVAYRDGQLSPQPKSILYPGSEQKPSPTLRERVKQARVDVCNKINNSNNGIREPNILGMLIPAGIGAYQLERDWLEVIDRFGERRGFTAHNGRVGMKNLPDPKVEREDTNKIVCGLRKIDALLTGLSE